MTKPKTDITRKVSTRAQKIAAVEEVRYSCEHKLFIRSAYLKNKYGVHQVIPILLDNSIIAENGTEHKYKWISSMPIPEIVDSIWKLHGKEDVKKQTVPVPVPPKAEPVVTGIRVMEDNIPKIDLAAALKHGQENTHRRLQEEITTCLDMCKEYGITNVAKYIADVLARKGVRFQ
jgi:hypothetical protein